MGPVQEAGDWGLDRHGDYRWIDCVFKVKTEGEDA
jgi:hypothetical protein